MKIGDPQAERRPSAAIPTAKSRGLAGLLVALPLRLRMLRTTRTLLVDLKHYDEHGTPSPRTQRRLASLLT